VKGGLLFLKQGRAGRDGTWQGETRYGRAWQGRTRQGVINLFGRIAQMGVPGTRASYDGMLKREEDF